MHKNKYLIVTACSYNARMSCKMSACVYNYVLHVYMHATVK